MAISIVKETIELQSINCDRDWETNAFLYAR